MDKQIILPNIGEYKGDYNSDTLYDAFKKVNYSMCVLSERSGVEVDKLCFEKYRSDYNLHFDIRPDFEIINRNLKKLDESIETHSSFRHWLIEREIIQYGYGYKKKRCNL